MRVRNRTRSQVHVAGVYLGAMDSVSIPDEDYEAWFAANREHARYLIDHHIDVEPEYFVPLDDPEPATLLTEEERLVAAAREAIPYIRDFTARGLPHTAALSSYTDEKITAAIRDRAWAEHQAENAADED